jgi:hypothetical protein
MVLHLRMPYVLLDSISQPQLCSQLGCGRHWWLLLLPAAPAALLGMSPMARQANQLLPPPHLLLLLLLLLLTVAGRGSGCSCRMWCPLHLWLVQCGC